MRKKLSYTGCDPSLGPSPRLKVKPPVFATPTDAWNHFVRHRDDFPLIDEDDDDNILAEHCLGQMDVFDVMDSVFDRSVTNSNRPQGSASAEPNINAEPTGNEPHDNEDERSEDDLE